MGLQILLTIKYVAWNFIGIIFPLIFCVQLPNAFFVPSLCDRKQFTCQTSPCQIFMVRLIPPLFVTGFCTFAKIFRKHRKTPPPYYIKLFHGGKGFSAIISCNNISFAQVISFLHFNWGWHLFIRNILK